MSNFTKVMLSAASGASGSSSANPYGSFYLEGIDGASGTIYPTMHKVAPLHIPTTDTMLVETTRSLTIDGGSTYVSNVVAVNKETGAQTALFISDYDTTERYTMIVAQWFADVENNGDYYIAFVSTGGFYEKMGSSVDYNGDNNTYRAGCVLIKYNKSHVQQWRRMVYDNAADPNKNQGYMPFFFFKGTELFAALSTMTDGQGFLFGRIDKSDGSADGAISHVSTSGLTRYASDRYFYGNRIYDPIDNKLYLGGRFIDTTSKMWMEKFTPSTTAGGFVNDYRKTYATSVNNSDEDHSFVADDSHIWSCCVDGNPLQIRQRLKSDFSMVSNYDIEFADDQLATTNSVRYTQIIQHPTDDNYLIGACIAFGNTSTYNYGLLFKFNKTTKTATIIDAWRSTNSNRRLDVMSGLTSDDTSIQVGWWANNNQIIFYHLAIDDIDNGTLSTTITGISSWANRRANVTVSTSSSSAITNTNESVLSFGTNSDFQSIVDSGNSGLTFESGNTYMTYRSYEA